MISDTHKTLIRTKSGGIQSQALVWENALARCLSLGMHPVEGERIIQAADNPEPFQIIAQLLESENGSSENEAPTRKALDNLFNTVDESAHPLSAWLKSLIVMQRWLMDKNRPQSNLTSQVGYIHCSLEAAQATLVEAPLESVVQDMLHQYGYEGEH